MGATINNISLMIELAADETAVGFKTFYSFQCVALDSAVVNTYTLVSQHGCFLTYIKHRHRESKCRSDHIIIRTIVIFVSFG